MKFEPSTQKNGQYLYLFYHFNGISIQIFGLACILFSLFYICESFLYNVYICMNKAIPILLLLGLFAIPCNLSQSFNPNYCYEDFYVQFGRNYQGEEKAQHEKIFNENYAELQRLRQQGHDVQVNKYMDWNSTQKEEYNSYRPETLNIPFSTLTLRSSSLFASPISYDWRSLGRVTSVKSQGSCGSCWSFASTAQYESLLAIETNGTLYDLAESYALECDTMSHGCLGGYANSALTLYNQTGIPQQTTYPYQQSSTYYKNRNRPICTETNRIKLSKPVTNVHFYSSLTNQQIQQNLVDFGPLTVGVYASQNAFMWAGRSGLISCSAVYGINHAILLVGYNTSHWFIKNSWDTNWGDNGFAYISKTADCNLHTNVNVMEVAFNSNPSPSPANVTYVTVVVTMSDSDGDGWNSNILGFKQNGVLVGIFGQSFTSGFSSGPTNIVINGKVQTQIVVVQSAAWKNEIGFVVKFTNGTIIFSQTPGLTYSSTIVFHNFCPLGDCPPVLTVTYYLTLTDSYGDGWNGNVLGFKQNGNIRTFTLSGGRTDGPIAYTFDRFVGVQIIVYIMGTWSYEIGYQLRTSRGSMVAQRLSGSYFSANNILNTFYPDAENLDPISEITSDKSKDKTVSDNAVVEDNNTNKGLIIAISMISFIAAISIGALIIVSIKLKRFLDRERFGKKCQLPVVTKSQATEGDMKYAIKHEVSNSRFQQGNTSLSIS